MYIQQDQHISGPRVPQKTILLEQQVQSPLNKISVSTSQANLNSNATFQTPSIQVPNYFSSKLMLNNYFSTHSLSSRLDKSIKSSVIQGQMRAPVTIFTHLPQQSYQEIPYVGDGRNTQIFKGISESLTGANLTRLQNLVAHPRLRSLNETKETRPINLNSAQHQLYMNNEAFSTNIINNYQQRIFNSQLTANINVFNYQNLVLDKLYPESKADLSCAQNCLQKYAQSSIPIKLSENYEESFQEKDISSSSSQNSGLLLSTSTKQKRTAENSKDGLQKIKQTKKVVVQVTQKQILLNQTQKQLIKQQKILDCVDEKQLQLSIALKRSESSRKPLTNDSVRQLKNNDVEKMNCMRYFRYNQAQLLHVLGKKEIYLTTISSKKPILTFVNINYSIKKESQQLKQTQLMIEKMKKIVATKGCYKYRERFNIASSAQLKAIGYDVKKRISYQQEKKSTSLKQIEKEHSSEEEISPLKGKMQKEQAQPSELGKWKKFNQVEFSTKVFIIKGGYGALRKSLIARGWVENPEPFSPCFDLKWTCKVQSIDYENLLENQVVNHFDNNKVFTSKYGLSRNLRTLINSDNIDIYKFFPRCYDLADLSEFEDFMENFKQTKAESILYKLKEKLLKNPLAGDKLELRVRTCAEIVSRKFIDIFDQINFIFVT